MNELKTKHPSSGGGVFSLSDVFCLGFVVAVAALASKQEPEKADEGYDDEDPPIAKAEELVALGGGICEGFDIVVA